MSDTTELSICDYESDSDLMDDLQSRRQLLGQINELQNAVDDMKSAFSVAIQRLSQVPQEEQSLWNKVEESRVECQTQVSEVLKLMLTMKADFAALKTQVQQSSEVQHGLRRQIQNLIWERNALIEELHKSGSVSDQIWYNLNRNARPVGRASTGSHSNDSGVAMPQTIYNLSSTAYVGSSDQESLSIMDNPLILSHAMVRDYVARHSQLQGAQSYGESNLLTAYDSDSSLVNAANKSLTLSTSLGKQCGLELDQYEMGDSDDDDDDDEDGSGGQPRSSKLTWNNIPDMLTETGQESSAKPLSTDVDSIADNARLRLAKEVLESERKYCSMLHTLLRTFAEPLMKAGIVSIKDVNTLFPDEINQLYFKHSSLCHALEEKVQNWVWNSTLGDVFDKFTDPLDGNVLQLYTSYIDDFPEVLKTFHKLCRKSTKFIQFLKSCLSRPVCGGLDLGVFLVAPVQRIPQYILLLKKLLKIADSGHPDVALINSCLHRLKESLNRLNDTMEHSFQLIAAQIQQEDDMDCMAVSCWPNAAEIMSVDHMRRRNVGDDNCLATQFNPSDCSTKKKTHARGNRVAAKIKEKDINRGIAESDSVTEVKLKPKTDCHSILTVQSQLKSDDGITNTRSKVESNSDCVTKSINNQKDESKPIKSKPPVKPCRHKGLLKASDMKSEKTMEMAEKMTLAATEISSFRSSYENITNSEPNLAQEQQVSMEMPSECQTRVTPFKSKEKVASMGCILMPSTTADDSTRIQRPLGKSESTCAIHHVTVTSASSMSTSRSIPAMVSAASTSGPTFTQPLIKQKTTKSKSKDKKLISIRASLKNILTFRKRYDTNYNYEHGVTEKHDNCCNNISSTALALWETSI
ncbi:Rho guanine nucleotide exchange factor (GEF) 33 [Chamberlinius hualienensis]